MGFKYQIRYALYLTFEAQRTHGLDVAIDIERIDDIDVHAAGKLTKLVQTKDTSTVLTNSSAPFWKTVRIWSEAIRRGEVDPAVIDKFELVATSQNPEEDTAIVNLLQKRDPQSRSLALQKMRSLSDANRHQATLGRAYQAFYDLTPAPQEQLIEKMVITTNAPDFDQLDLLICRQIVHGPPDKRAVFAKVLFGRWDQLVESYLRSSARSRISWDELQSLLHDIALQFEEDNLPTDFLGMLHDALPSLSDDKRTFLRQLLAIGATDQQRTHAQRLFLRATQLLGFWQRNLLVRPDEVLRHNERLVNECGLQHDTAAADSSLAGEPPEQIGRRIYNWAINIAPHQEGLRIRRRCADPNVVRGTFQALADEPRLGWHPSWNSMFRSNEGV